MNKKTQGALWVGAVPVRRGVCSTGFGTDYCSVGYNSQC